MRIRKTIYHIWCGQSNYIPFNTCIAKFERRGSYAFSKCYSTQSDTEQNCEVPVKNIRNFSIVAHVDHGKSTLADRLLEITGAIKINSGKQVLDTLQVEKDRGITVKAQTASLNYNYKGTTYLLNLIDTPGHVDFCAEVHRSLTPCQGVVLVVDANDGVQAQTVANFYLATKKDLFVIPVINKIDLKNADPDRVVKQLESLFSFKDTDILKISAKLGTGVEKVLDAVVEKIPPPIVDMDKPFRALTFDSWFSKHKGAISLVYVKEGKLSVGSHITSMHTKKSYEVKSLSLLRPAEQDIKTLFAGQIGCITCNMRSSKEAYIGDTIHLKNDIVEPLVGFSPPKPMVFSGVYPIDQSQFDDLRNAIDKLTLNDSGVSATLDSSAALGRGWRIGFLGLLHMEVFIQRLEQEYGAQPVVTIPSVTYKADIFGSKNIKKYSGDTIIFNNPICFPDIQIVSQFYEPMVIGTIIMPEKYLGTVMALCLERRGIEKECKEIGADRLMMQFILPLNEIIVDFHDTLKCITSGYASFDYEDHEYQATKIVKLCIALNGTIVDEFSSIVHVSKAITEGKKLCAKLAEVIPRQLFEIAIQALVGSKVVARETLKAYKKDVTAKLYGGDVTRRMKLLAQQREGKKKMRMIGKISVPREAFVDVLKR